MSVNEDLLKTGFRLVYFLNNFYTSGRVVNGEAMKWFPKKDSIKIIIMVNKSNNTIKYKKLIS